MTPKTSGRMAPHGAAPRPHRAHNLAAPSVPTAPKPGGLVGAPSGLLSVSEWGRLRTLVQLFADETGAGQLELLGMLHQHGAERATERDGDLVATAFAGCLSELLDLAHEAGGGRPIQPEELRLLLITRGVWAMTSEERQASEEREREAELQEMRRKIRSSADHPERQRRKLLRFDPVMRRAAVLRLGGSVVGERGVKLRCPRCHKRDVWCLVAPDRAHWANCNHLNKCGWSGPLHDLGA